jgi:hypothetical protein
VRWIDPPSGWKYGFPKPFEAAPGQEINDWLINNGYPQSEIDSWQGRPIPCRVQNMRRAKLDESSGDAG